MATGDVRAWLHGRRSAKAVCGHWLPASVDYRVDGLAVQDAVAVDDMPLVDVCTRCVRLSGAPVTITVRERLVTIHPA